MASSKRQDVPQAEQAAEINGLPRWFVETLVDVLGVDEEECQPTTTLDHLNADALDLVELAMALEDALNLPTFDDAIVDSWPRLPLAHILTDCRRAGGNW